MERFIGTYKLGLANTLEVHASNNSKYLLLDYHFGKRSILIEISLEQFKDILAKAERINES